MKICLADFAFSFLFFFKNFPTCMLKVWEISSACEPCFSSTETRMITWVRSSRCFRFHTLVASVHIFTHIFVYFYSLVSVMVNWVAMTYCKLAPHNYEVKDLVLCCGFFYSSKFWVVRGQFLWKSGQSEEEKKSHVRGNRSSLSASVCRQTIKLSNSSRSLKVDWSVMRSKARALNDTDDHN